MRSMLFKSVSEQNSQKFCISLLRKYNINLQRIKQVVEIGGSTDKNASKLISNSSYLNLDIKTNNNINTLVCDCCKNIPIKNNSIDLVYCNNTFEHLAKPWITAKEITRILSVGGVVFCAAPFSWRYHPVPEDYFRYSPSGFCSLFDELKILECNFNSYFRRTDMRGFWKNGLDSVPVDEWGGWRENWLSYVFAQKLSSNSKLINFLFWK